MRRFQRDTTAIEALLEHVEAAGLVRGSTTTALLLVVYHRDAAAAAQLLQGPAPGLQAALWGAAFRAAAARGHGDLVALFLRHTTAVTPPDRYWGRTTALNARDSWGRSALLWAASRGHAAVVSQLLKAGACAHNLKVRLETALGLAITEGHADVVRVIMRHSEHVGHFALEEAACARQAAVVLALLQAGASTDRLPDRAMRNVAVILEQECQASGMAAAGTWHTPGIGAHALTWHCTAGAGCRLLRAHWQALCKPVLLTPQASSTASPSACHV